MREERQHCCRFEKPRRKFFSCFSNAPASGILSGSMFTLSEVSKSYGGRTLFEDVTLQLNRDDRLGLVGPNGAGKSTLFKLILGQEECDHGAITSQRGATVGFLPQENAPVGDETVIELATAITPDFVELRRKIKAWDTAHPDDIDPHDNLHARFDEMGGWQLDAKAKRFWQASRSASATSTGRRAN